MPECSVPGCRNNYKLTAKTDGYTRCFRMPREAARREEWARAFSGSNWTPKDYSHICIKHFHPDDIVLVERYKNKEGVWCEYKLPRPMLSRNAVPKLFIELSPVCSETPVISGEEKEPVLPAGLPQADDNDLISSTESLPNKATDSKPEDRPSIHELTSNNKSKHETSAVARIGEIPLWNGSGAQEKTIVASIELTNVDNPIRNEDIEVPKSDGKIKIKCNDGLNIDGQVGSPNESSSNEDYVKTDNIESSSTVEQLKTEHELPNVDCQVDSIKSSKSVDRMEVECNEFLNIDSRIGSSELPNNVNQMKICDSELLNSKNQIRVINIESLNSYTQSTIDTIKLSNSNGKTEVGSPELPNNVDEIKIVRIESLGSEGRGQVDCKSLNSDNQSKVDTIKLSNSNGKTEVGCPELPNNVDEIKIVSIESLGSEGRGQVDCKSLNSDNQSKVDTIKLSNSNGKTEVGSPELPNNVDEIKIVRIESLGSEGRGQVDCKSLNSDNQSKVDTIKLSNSNGKTEVGCPELPNNVDEIKIVSIESLGSEGRGQVDCKSLNSDNQSKVDTVELSSIAGKIEIGSPELHNSIDEIKISTVQSFKNNIEVGCKSLKSANPSKVYTTKLSSSNRKTEVDSTDPPYNIGQIKISSILSLNKSQVKTDSKECSVKSSKTDSLVKINSSESLIVDSIKSSKPVREDQDKVGIIESSNSVDQVKVASVELYLNEDLTSDSRIKFSNSDDEVNVANIELPHDEGDDKVSRIESVNSEDRLKGGSFESPNSQDQVKDLRIEYAHIKVDHTELAPNKGQFRINRIESPNSHDKIKIAKIELSRVESYGKFSRIESTKDDQGKAGRESPNSESVVSDDQVVMKELPHRTGENKTSSTESSMSNGLPKVANPQLGPGVELNKDGTIKRKRGRPRKYKIDNDAGIPEGRNTELVNTQGQVKTNTQLEPIVRLNEDGTPKRGRGRPRKRKPGRPRKDPNSDDEWRPVNSFVEPTVDARVLRLKSEMKNNLKRLVEGSYLSPETPQTLKNDGVEDREDSCCVLTCPNTAESCRLVSFPIEPKWKRRWMVRIGRPNWSPSHQSRICEVHFEPKMWMTHGDGSVVLRPEALPTMFMKQENNIKPFFTCDRSGRLIATRGQSILQKEFCRSKKMRDAIEAVAEGMPFLLACQTFNIKRLKLMMRYCRTLGIKTSATKRPKGNLEQKTAPPVFVEEMVVDEPRVYIKSEVMETETRVENEMDPEEMNVFIKSESLEPEIEVTEAEGSSAELFETVFCDTNMDHQEVNVHPMAQHPPSLQVKAQFNEEPESVLPDVMMSPERAAECVTAAPEMSVDPIAPLIHPHLSLAESLPIPKLSSLPVECQVCRRVLSCRRNWVHHLIRLHPDEEITKRLIVEREARRLSTIKKPTICSSSTGTITSILGSLLTSSAASRDKSTDTGGLSVSEPPTPTPSPSVRLLPPLRHPDLNSSREFIVDLGSVKADSRLILKQKLMDLVDAVTHNKIDPSCIIIAHTDSPRRSKT